MNALITGASGFVGRHLLAHLVTSGDTAVGVDRDGPEPVDVVSAPALRRAVERAAPDVVYHLAASSHVGESWNDVDGLMRVNVDGTRNVLDACAAVATVRVIVVVGSAEEYGAVRTNAPIPEDTPLRPITPYGESKVRAEALAADAFRESGLPVVLVRAFNHTGPGQSERFLVPALAARVARAERDGHTTIDVGNLDTTRDITDVRDVVRAYRLLAQHGQPGQAYNVCSGRGIQVADIAHGFLALARCPLELSVDPALVRAVDVPALVGDPAKLAETTGWIPELLFDRTLVDLLDEARSRV
ncbi:MAG TPA: GDP-mannose 4,6-dehydratase [Acidimicrobiia bacterium]